MKAYTFPIVKEEYDMTELFARKNIKHVETHIICGLALQAISNRIRIIRSICTLRLLNITYVLHVIDFGAARKRLIFYILFFS